MASQQKFTLTIPDGYDEQTRKSIGEEAVKVIIARSKRGKDKHNASFPGYSKSYYTSFDFKLGGKSKGNVNLTLSNEMLNSIEVLDTDNKNEIVIGIPEDDTLNNAKAEGNILGTYGQKSPIRGKARDFMGLTEKESKSILSKFKVKEKESSSAIFDTLRSAGELGLATRFFPDSPSEGTNEF